MPQRIGSGLDALNFGTAAAGGGGGSTAWGALTGVPSDVLALANGTPITHASTFQATSILADSVAASRLLGNLYPSMAAQNRSTATYDDIDPGADGVLQITGGTVTLTGIMITTDPEPYGRQLVLLNSTAGDLTLKHQNAGSSAVNRFKLPGAGDFVIPPDMGVTLVYDSGSDRWVIAS